MNDGAKGAAAAQTPSKRVFTCHFCGTVLKRPMRCGSCRSVFYCSRTCQANDWPAHKAYCRAARERALLEESGLVLPAVPAPAPSSQSAAPQRPRPPQGASATAPPQLPAPQHEPRENAAPPPQQQPLPPPGTETGTETETSCGRARQVFASAAECDAAVDAWLHAPDATAPAAAPKTPLEARLERTTLGSELLLLLRRCTLMAQLEALPLAVQDERRQRAMLDATMAAVRSAAAAATAPTAAAASQGGVPAPVQVLVLAPACARLPLSVAACAAREGLRVVVAAVDQHAELHRATRETLHRNRTAPGADRVRAVLCEGFRGLGTALGCSDSNSEGSDNSGSESDSSNSGSSPSCLGAARLAFCADVLVFDGFDGSFAGTGLFEALRSGALAACCGRATRVVPHAVRVMAALGTLRRTVDDGGHDARALVDALWSPRMLVTDPARPVAVRAATEPFVAYQYNLQGALRRCLDRAAAPHMRDYFAATRFVAARRCAPTSTSPSTVTAAASAATRGPFAAAPLSSSRDGCDAAGAGECADVATAWLELYASDDAEAAPFLSTREPTLSLGTMLQALAPRPVLGAGAVRLHVVVRATGALAVSTRGGAATQAAAPELYTFPPTPPPAPLVWDHPALLDEGRLCAVLHGLDMVLKRRRDAITAATANTTTANTATENTSTTTNTSTTANTATANTATTNAAVQKEQGNKQVKEGKGGEVPATTTATTTATQTPTALPQHQRPFVVTVGTPTACVALHAARAGAEGVLLCAAQGALCTACRAGVRGVRGVHAVRAAPLGLQPGRTAHYARPADVLVHTPAAPGFFADGAVPFVAVAHEHRAVAPAAALLPAAATLCAALLDTKIAVAGQRHEYAEGLLVRNHRACDIRAGSASAAPHWAFLSRPVPLFTFDLRRPGPLRAVMEAAVARYASARATSPASRATTPAAATQHTGTSAEAGDEATATAGTEAEVDPLHAHVAVPVCRAGTLCAVAVWLEYDVDGTRTVRLSSEPAEFYERAGSAPGSAGSTPVHWCYHFDAVGQVVHWLPTQHAVAAGDVVALDADHDLRTLLVGAAVAHRGSAGGRGSEGERRACALPAASLDPAPAFALDLGGIRQSLVAVVAERLQDTRRAFAAAASTWRLLGVVTEYAEELGIDPQVAADFVAHVCRTLYP